MKKDIENREDIILLVRKFYTDLLKEKEFQHIFLDVAKIDVLAHQDLIVDFWETALFHTAQYKRNTLQKHLDIHMDYRLTEQHFNDWLQIFNQTVDRLFEGDIAEIAKTRAKSIASLIRIKINQLERLRLELNN